MSAKRLNTRIGRIEPLESRIVFSVEYFVDSLHGSDSNDGQSPTTALRTVERLVSQYESLKPPGHVNLGPGDIVTLMPGEHQFAYRYGEGQWQGLFLRNVHGTSSQPITIRGMDGAKINNRAPDGSEMFALNILQSSYIRVENLDITSYGSAVSVAEANNVIIRDSYIHDVDGIAANNLSGVLLTGVRDVVIENNLFSNNFDRTKPGNANNRHIVVFGSADVKVLGNTMHSDDPSAGMAVDYKHLGGLPPDQVGQYEVAYNTIINAAGTAIGTAAPNSHIHHNLLIDSGSIRVADLGGTAQLANERIEFNTIINNLARSDGSGLSYFPAEYAGYPLGDLYWSHNLVIDNRLYDHPEKSTLLVDRYGSDEYYQRVFPGGLFHAVGNIYQTRDRVRFDLYGANGGRYGQLGSYLTFAEWQAAGYDLNGAVSNIQVDQFFRDQSSLSQRAGIYAGGTARLTAMVSQLDIDEAGSRSVSRLRIVRSGAAHAQPLSVTIRVSQAGELRVPMQVVIPAGADAIEVEVQGLPDDSNDVTEALQIEVVADGFASASTWIRLHDTPASDDEGDPSVDPAGIFQVPGSADESVTLQSVVTRRWAEYDNEMGVAYVDDAQGRIGQLLPTNPGWISALMNRGQHLTVLPSGAGQGDFGQVELTGGRYFVFYLVQDSSAEQWRVSNPGNDLQKSPLLFTSIDISNPDRFDHVREELTPSSVDLAWEDLNFGGDLSFTDLVVRNTYLAPDNACQAIDDVYRAVEPTSLELDVLANDTTSAAVVIEAVTQPEFGSVQVSPPRDRLIFTPAPNRYGLVHFTYTIGAQGISSSATVELAVAKQWTNVNMPTDVNQDGRVTALDALLVINALHRYAQTAVLTLPEYPTGELASLNSVDVDGDRRLTLTDALLVIVGVIETP